MFSGVLKKRLEPSFAMSPEFRFFAAGLLVLSILLILAAVSP
jgi:hypothetical protein